MHMAERMIIGTISIPRIFLAFFPSLLQRHSASQPYAFGGNDGLVGPCFDTFSDCLFEEVGEGGIDEIGGGKAVGIGSLDEVEAGYTMTLAGQGDQLPQMLLAPKRYGVREESHLVFHESDVFRFDPKRPTRSFQQGIQTALTDSGFAPEAVIAGHFGNEPVFPGQTEYAVRHQGIDAYPEIIASDELEGIGQASFEVGGGREEHLEAGPEEAKHTARVVAVSPEALLAELDLDEKSFVTASKASQKAAFRKADQRESVHCLLLTAVEGTVAGLAGDGMEGALEVRHLFLYQHRKVRDKGILIA